MEGKLSREFDQRGVEPLVGGCPTTSYEGTEPIETDATGEC